MEQRQFVTNQERISEEQLRKVVACLSNSYSAEHSLSLLSLTEGDLTVSAENWTIPQAYYAALFSFKAVVMPRQVATPTSSAPEQTEYSLLKRSREFADLGLYKGVFDTHEILPFIYLSQFALVAQPGIIHSAIHCQAVPLKKQMTLPEFVAVQVGLAKYVSRVQLAHERFLINSLGLDTFTRVIAQMPDYVIESDFLRSRLALHAQ